MSRVNATTTSSAPSHQESPFSIAAMIQALPLGKPRCSAAGAVFPESVRSALQINLLSTTGEASKGAHRR